MTENRLKIACCVPDHVVAVCRLRAWRPAIADDDADIQVACARSSCTTSWGCRGPGNGFGLRLSDLLKKSSEMHA